MYQGSFKICIETHLILAYSLDYGSYIEKNNNANLCISKEIIDCQQKQQDHKQWRSCWKVKTAVLIEHTKTKEGATTVSTSAYSLIVTHHLQNSLIVTHHLQHSTFPHCNPSLTSAHSLIVTHHLLQHIPSL